MASIDYSIKDVEKVVKFDGKVKNVEVTRLTAPGENFLSLVLRVDFEVEKNGHSKTISSVAKRLPMGQKPGGFDMHGPTMANEIKWYSEIIPLFKNFGKENGITIDFFPECYGSRYSLDPTKRKPDTNSVLLLENLIPQGYQNDDRYIGSDLITSKAILKRLAIFHALPIAIKKKKPQLFEIIKDYLDKSQPEPPSHPGSNEHRGPPGPPGSDNHRGPPGPSSGDGNNGPPDEMRKVNDALVENLLNIPDFSPYISKIEPFLARPLMGPEVSNTKTKEPWNTILHNDFWVNNIMVNKKEKKEPLVKIVDFQMCTYGTFVKDLVFFLLTSVRNDIIIEHFDDLFRFYYDEFINVLQKATVDFEFTYEEYLKEIQFGAHVAFGHALMFSTVVFGEKNASVDVAVSEFDPGVHFLAMLKKMNQYQKDKLVVMASEAIRRKWI